MAIKHASAPKAYFNITGLGFAKLTKEGAELKYSDITKTRGLQKIGVETGGELKTAYADGGPIESGNTDGEGKISLQMHAFLKRFAKLFLMKIMMKMAFTKRNKVNKTIT